MLHSASSGRDHTQPQMDAATLRQLNERHVTVSLNRHFPLGTFRSNLSKTKKLWYSYFYNFKKLLDVISPVFSSGYFEAINKSAEMVYARQALQLNPPQIIQKLEHIGRLLLSKSKNYVFHGVSNVQRLLTTRDKSLCSLTHVRMTDQLKETGYFLFPRNQCYSGTQKQ